jgi:transcription-repair coupling factor (superfamily II helicase)
LDIRGAGDMLGAEQSGFITDLGYETYQKILEEAVQELKNEEFADLYKDDSNETNKGSLYVLETAVESDMELLFSAYYIPNDSERISIYRELDTLESDREINAFRTKLEDRFGKIPPQGEELIQIVRLKRLAKELGVERIILKMGKMNLQLVSNHDSSYYQSKTFDKVLNFAQKYHVQCRLKEDKNRRSLIIQNIKTVKQAYSILSKIGAV